MRESIELYTTRDGETLLEVRMEADSVWLTRTQLAELFDRDVKTIGKHIANALREELEGEATIAKFATVQREGSRPVTHQIEHYNLDLIISVGYRVKSSEGVRFRKWATSVLRRYLVEGAAVNTRRAVCPGGFSQSKRHDRLSVRSRQSFPPMLFSGANVGTRWTQ